MLIRRNQGLLPQVTAAAAPPASLNPFFRKFSTGDLEARGSNEEGEPENQVPQDSAQAPPESLPQRHQLRPRQSFGPAERPLSPPPDDAELVEEPIHKPLAVRPSNHADPASWASATPPDRSVTTALRAYSSLQAAHQDFPLASLKGLLDEIETNWTELHQLKQARQTAALRFTALNTALAQEPSPGMILERDKLRTDLLFLDQELLLKLDNDLISSAILFIENRIAEEGQVLSWNEPAAYELAKEQWEKWTGSYHFQIPATVTQALEELKARLRDMTANLEAAGPLTGQAVDGALVCGGRRRLSKPAAARP